jgi:hypothetical protein
LDVINARFAGATTNPFQPKAQSYGDEGIGTSSYDISYDISLNPESHNVKIKLLTKADVVLCESALSGDVGPDFFDDLASPTLQDAIDAGGCQYFGVLKHMVPYYDSFTVNFAATGGYFNTGTFYASTSYSASIGWTPVPVASFTAVDTAPDPDNYNFDKGHVTSYSPIDFTGYDSTIGNYFIVLRP